MSLGNFIGAIVVGIFWYFITRHFAPDSADVPVLVYTVLAWVSKMVLDIWEVRPRA